MRLSVCKQVRQRCLCESCVWVRAVHSSQRPARAGDRGLGVNLGTLALAHCLHDSNVIDSRRQTGIELRERPDDEKWSRPLGRHTAAQNKRWK